MPVQGYSFVELIGENIEQISMLFLRGLLLGVLLVFVPVIALAAKFDPRMTACAREADPQRRAEVCSRLINSGTLQHVDLLWAYNNRAISHVQLNKIRAALNDLESALLLDSSFAPAYYTRGMIRLHLRAYDKAIKDFDQALNAAEKSGKRFGITYNESVGGKVTVGADLRVLALLSRSTALVAVKRLNEAEKSSRDALAIAPSDPRAYNNLGYIHLLREDYQSSIKFYEKGLALAPNDRKMRAGLKAARDAAKR